MAAQADFPVSARMRWRCTAMTLAVCASAASHAQQPLNDCAQTGIPKASPFADREGIITSMQGMPEVCLKALFAECAAHADDGLVDFGTAAMCSMNYEALLRKSFGGNFHAMMAWWRSERGNAPRR